MLSIANKPIMLSVIRLNVVMLIVVTPTQLEPPAVGFKTCVKVTYFDKPSSLIQHGLNIG